MDDRQKRLIEIHRLIETEPHKWTYGRLGRRFGVSKTQIYRDIKYLKHLGYAIQITPPGLFLEPDEKSVTPHGG